MKKKYLFPIFLIFCFFGFEFSYSQSLNDNCASASVLPIGITCSSTSFTFTSNTIETGTSNPALCNTVTANRDGWYTITTNSTTTSILLDGTTNRPWSLSLYSGNCSGFTQIACANAAASTAISLPVSVLPNTTYYVRINRTNTGNNAFTGTICAYAAATPVNNLCANAINLPCSTSNLAGTTVGTNSVTNGTGCIMGDYGVWYNFIGDGNQTTISSTSSVGFDHEMSISSGNCGSLVSLSCNDVGLTNGTETATFTTVTGTNYYVYISHYASASTIKGAFTISRTCAPPPIAPINDECINAISLTVASTCTYSTYSNANATSSLGIPVPGCANYAGGDVWFKAVVPASGILNIDMQTGVILDSGLALYSGTCSGLTLLSCDDDSSINGAMSYLSQNLLTPGQTIYIRVWEYGNDNNGTFGICVSSPTCVAPTLNVTTAITQTSATISWTTPTPNPLNGYQYVVSTSNVTPTGAGIATSLNSINLTGLTPDTTYYLFVRSNCGSGDFSIWTPFGIFSTGYCTSISTTSTYFINNFSTSGGTSNISNLNSGYSTNGYGNFTPQVVSQSIFGSVSFVANFFNGTNSYGFNIWVDWNDDFDFDDAGETVFLSGAFVTSSTGTFIVPGTAISGNHRMRIRANYLSSNPDKCGSITSGETEDYTLTVLAPLPCSGNPSNIIVTLTPQTTVTWTAAIPAPANGYQYYYSTSPSTPTISTIPSGSTVAGITSVNLLGLLQNTTHYVWVRSNCGGSLGQGVWVGPTVFIQPCNVNSGIGTSTFGCPSVDAGGLGLNGTDPAPIGSCAASLCTTLEANYLQLGQTTSYNVQSIPYSPPYQFNCLANQVSVNSDDIWSPLISLPFNFCFYGNSYNSCTIGSNSMLSFNPAYAGTASGYSFANNLPSTVGALFTNTIYGVYHDINPSKGGQVAYELINLPTGCRALVASWNNIPMFSDNTILYTGMIVLYENTNIIEVYIKEKRVDNNDITPWNGGNAIVGIQNSTGTIATVAPNRNGLDTNWTATNEAWRFVPSGTAITSIKWYQGTTATGAVLGTSSTLNVCPTTTTSYTAEVTYNLCNATTLVKTDYTTVTIGGGKTWNGSVDSDWNKNNNWTPTGIPNLSDCVIIPITSNNPIVSGTNYNGMAGTLAVLNGATLTVNSNNAVTVTNWVSVQATGTFLINNNASLVQINNVTNTGDIIYKRNATIRNLDYVYWSSPVVNFNVSTIATPLVAGAIYKWNTIIANPNGGQGNWENASGDLMNTAKGYIVRGPSSFSSTVSSTLFGSFKGVPNNGTITFPISRGSDTNTAFHTGLNGTEINNYSDNWNLTGNPYPSSIRASQFLFDNNSKIEGNIRLWTHGNLPASIPSPFYNSFVYNYNAGDYLTYNFTGTSCCPTAASDLFIGSAQGFFVVMKDGAAASNTITFNNNLRSATYTNNYFFKNNNPNSAITSNLIDLERHRYWLDIIDSNNQSDRILIGYIEGATNQRDSFFDSNTFYTGSMALFSTLENEKFNIQGRSLPFQDTDEVPLGIYIPTTGNYSIAIASLDGIFENQNIYLKDNLLNTITNIKLTPFQFSANQGYINNRFSIVYLDAALANSNFNLENTIKVISINYLAVKSSNELLESVEVYDVLGRKLAHLKNINANEIQLTNLQKNNTTLLLKIKLQNGFIKNEKVIY